jgi:hypothetical protein
MQRCRPGDRAGAAGQVPAPLFGWMHDKPGKRRGGVSAWMLDDVEFRELRIFLPTTWPT